MRHRPARLPPARPLPLPAGSDRARSPAWSRIRSLPARPPGAAAPRPAPTPRAGTAASRSAGSPRPWRRSGSPPPGSCLACPAGRRTAAPRRPSAGPSLESRCRRRSRQRSAPVAVSRAARAAAPRPAPPRRSSQLSPPDGAATAGPPVGVDGSHRGARRQGYAAGRALRARLPAARRHAGKRSRYGRLRRDGRTGGMKPSLQSTPGRETRGRSYGIAILPAFWFAWLVRYQRTRFHQRRRRLNASLQCCACKCLCRRFGAH